MNFCLFEIIRFREIFILKLHTDSFGANDVWLWLQTLIYSGQLDIIVALPLTEAMLQTTPWKYLDQYKSADRTVWKVNPNDTEVAGYVRNVKDFYQVKNVQMSSYVVLSE